jgi:hypothetical protein
MLMVNVNVLHVAKHWISPGIKKKQITKILAQACLQENKVRQNRLKPKWKLQTSKLTIENVFSTFHNYYSDLEKYFWVELDLVFVN